MFIGSRHTITHLQQDLRILTVYIRPGLSVKAVGKQTCDWNKYLKLVNSTWLAPPKINYSVKIIIKNVYSNS